MRVYGSEELLHERRMQEIGENRIRSQMSKARQHDILSVTVPGRAVMRRFVTPIAAVLRGWIAHEDDTRAGSCAQIKPLVDMVGPDTIALIGLQTIVNGLHRPRRLSSVASSIGLGVEDEHVCREMERKNPGLWRDWERRTRSNKPQNRRTRILFQAKVNGLRPERWSIRDRAAIGLLVIDAAVLSTRLVETRLERQRHRSIAYLVPTTETLEWLESAEDAAARACPYYLPTVEPPIPWDSPQGGGYLTDLVLGREIARFRSPRQRAALDRPDADPTMAYRALNVLQSTPWAVDEDVRQVLEHIWEGAAGVAGLPPREDPPFPPKPDDIETNALARREYAAAALANHRRIHEIRSRRLAVANHRASAAIMAPYPRFYMPHRLDFRGRAYAMPAVLSCQGPDLCRGLLTFAEGAETTGWEPLRWLWIHGANVWGVRGSLYDRRVWVETEGHHIAREVARDPIDCRLWTEASEPWQFLAWCLEIDRVIESKEPETHLPVHVDASNNGLQILSILSGDRTMATATNVIPSEDGMPMDIYTLIADRVTRDMVDDEGDSFAEFWLSRVGGAVPRSCVKRPVMTLPYGVTEWSAQAYVRDWARASGYEKDTPVPFGQACLYLAKLIMTHVREVCSGAVTVMDWFQAVSDAVTRKGKGTSLSWISPSGWPVVHPYSRGRIQKIKAPLAACVSRINIRHETQRVDARRSRQGVAPNFVHSLDAAVLHHALDGWEHPIGTVHDAFATLSPYMDELRVRLRAAVVNMVLQSDPLNTLAAFCRREYRVEIPDPPEPRGIIEPDEVMSSHYIFS